MAPNGTPSKCIVLVGEGFSCLTEPFNDVKACPSTLLNGNSLELSNLNRMAKEGSSGTLMIEKWDFEGKKVNDIFQLLGLANVEKEKMADSLKERYKDMKVNLLSNDSSIVSFINQNKILENAQLLKMDFNNKDKLGEAIASELEKSVVLFVHLKLVPESVKDGLKCFENIISKYINNDDIICSVALTYADRYNANLMTYYDKPQLQNDEYQLNNTFILPKQSGCHKLGKFVEVESVPISVCYRHNGAIRRDLREKFSEDDCKHGGNGSILTYHFLAELAYKLGYTAKFGA